MGGVWGERDEQSGQELGLRMHRHIQTYKDTYTHTQRETDTFRGTYNDIRAHEMHCFLI